MFHTLFLCQMDRNPNKYGWMDGEKMGDSQWDWQCWHEQRFIEMKMETKRIPSDSMSRMKGQMGNEIVTKFSDSFNNFDWVESK